LTTGDFGHVLTEAAYLGIAAIVVAENWVGNDPFEQFSVTAELFFILYSFLSSEQILKKLLKWQHLKINN
jgi:hypothetical protein